MRSQCMCMLYSDLLKHSMTLGITFLCMCHTMQESSVMKPACCIHGTPQNI